MFYERQIYRRVWQRCSFLSCYQLIQSYLINGYSVLFYSTNLNSEFPTYLYDISEATGAPLAIVHGRAPQDTGRRRLKERKAERDANAFTDAGWLIYARLVPVEEPVQRDHYMLDTSKDIAPVLDEVVEWARSSGQIKVDR